MSVAVANEFRQNAEQPGGNRAVTGISTDRLWRPSGKLETSLFWFSHKALQAVKWRLVT